MTLLLCRWVRSGLRASSTPFTPDSRATARQTQAGAMGPEPRDQFADPLPQDLRLERQPQQVPVVNAATSEGRSLPWQTSFSLPCSAWVPRQALAGLVNKAFAGHVHPVHGLESDVDLDALG